VRGLTRLPDKIKPAVLEFIHGWLLENPRRVGSRLLEPPLDGIWRAQRGEYVAFYDVVDQTVSVLRIERRRTVYDGPLPD